VKHLHGWGHGVADALAINKAHITVSACIMTCGIITAFLPVIKTKIKYLDDFRIKLLLYYIDLIFVLKYVIQVFNTQFQYNY